MVRLDIDDVADTLLKMGKTTRTMTAGLDVAVCTTHAPVPWDKAQFEETFHVAIPEEIERFWNRVSGVDLYLDDIYGQYGIIIVSPDGLPALYEREADHWKEDLRDGDLIIGRFQGDLDIIILRCDDAMPDYGSIIIATAIAHRGDGEWSVAAPSLTEFIRRLLAANGEWFWEIRPTYRDITTI